MSDQGPEGLAFWESVELTDKDHCKPVKYGSRRFTTVNATHAKREATRLWGPYGAAWGLRDLKWGHFAKDGDAEVWLEAKFFCPFTSFEVSSDIKWVPGQDCRKKLQTDVLKKGMSYLGFFADLYLDRFDDQPYDIDTEALVDNYETAETVCQAINNAPDLDTVEKYWNAAKKRLYGRAAMIRIKDAYDERKQASE